MAVFFTNRGRIPMKGRTKLIILITEITEDKKEKIIKEEFKGTEKTIGQSLNTLKIW